MIFQTGSPDISFKLANQNLNLSAIKVFILDFKDR